MRTEACRLLPDHPYVFVECGKCQRCGERIGNAILPDVYAAWHHEIRRRREEAKSRTLEARKGYNSRIGAKPGVLNRCATTNARMIRSCGTPTGLHETRCV